MVWIIRVSQLSVHTPPAPPNITPDNREYTVVTSTPYMRRIYISPPLNPNSHVVSSSFALISSFQMQGRAVSVATTLRVDAREIMVGIVAVTGDFSLLQSVRTACWGTGTFRRE
jgi:hypothetical protein